jgi:hypothetical protein
MWWIQEWPQMVLRRKHTPTPTLTHTYKYVILIAFPQQQWFRERTSLLRYMYIACPVDIAIYVADYPLINFTRIHCRVKGREDVTGKEP